MSILVLIRYLLLEECHLCTFLKVKILDANHGQHQWIVPASLEDFFYMLGGTGTNFHIFLNALKA